MSIGRFSARAISFSWLDCTCFRVVGNNLMGQSILRVKGLQLQQQAFPKVARTNPDGIEILHDGDGVIEIVLRVFAILHKLFRGGGQIAVFVEVADDLFHQFANFF